VVVALQPISPDSRRAGISTGIAVPGQGCAGRRAVAVASQGLSLSHSGSL